MAKQGLKYSYKVGRHVQTKTWEEYFNRGAKALPLLKIGDVVRMKPAKEKKSGQKHA